MIKLKSLFRRGQGTSSSSSSSSAAAAQKQQQQHSNNNRQKSQSTTSLNTAHEQREQHHQQQQQQQQQHTHKHHHQQQQQPTSTKFYPSLDANAYERGVDVGDDERTLLNNRQTLGQATNNHTQQQQQQQQHVNSNTLPHKKSKFKGQKQPKQLPVPIEQQQQLTRTATTTTASTSTSSLSNAVVPPQQAQLMTSIAAAPPAPTGTVAMSNNNYNMTEATAAPGTAATVAVPSGSTIATGGGGGAADAQDVYSQLNTLAFPTAAAATALAAAAAAASGYQQQQQQQQQHHQFINNEQQQQQLLEANNKLQELQTHLERLSRENLALETRIAELLPYQAEVSKLHADLIKIQRLQEKSQLEIGNLKYENESLRNRLRDVVNSPLSDAEKHQIIQDSQRLHSSAPASIALPNTNESNDMSGGTPCLTPDWDKHSSSSEISVACLQDKIIQMEETHYSTNEELQATLQELADLQSQLSDTQTENERLAEEKDVLFQSLCRQTEKLNESRTQISTLQELLLRGDNAKQAEAGNAEREKKLLDLIKTSQEEREAVLVKQEELNAELQDLRTTKEAGQQEQQRQRERIALLDSTLDATNAERKQTEAQLLQAKEEISQRGIELNRVNTLLDNARSKIDELEADLARGDKTDLSDVLDAARKEKDALEERVAELQDQCERSQAEIRRLKDQLSVLNEECKVAKNNAKCAVSHLEYRLEQLQQEKDKLALDYQQLNESIGELHVQCKCHQEDKAQLQQLLSETQRHLGDVEMKLGEAETRLEQESKLRKQEAEEWQQFQADLLMTVRVANDFKTEALSAREQLVLDNKTQKEKIRLLEQQIEKLNKQQMQQNETQQSVLSTVQQEMASRRSKIGAGVGGVGGGGGGGVGMTVGTGVGVGVGVTSFSRQDSRLSVKTLIESIENNKQSKQDELVTAAVEASQYDSTNSLNSSTPSDAMSPIIMPVTSSDWHEGVRLPAVIGGNNGGSNNTVTPSITTATTAASTLTNTKGPLREQQPPQQQQQTTPTTPSALVSSINYGNVSKSTLLSGERKDPLNMLAKNGGSKRNALLKWCQNKTVGYRNIDITNFSSSWNDGLAFCAILHSYLPDRIPYDTLSPANKRRNFSLAFAAAESVGIPTTLNINDMCQIERPDWTQVISYVTAIYKYFET